MTGTQLPQQVRFMAKMTNTKLFHSILKALNFADMATVQLSGLGIRVMVEDSATLQSSVYIRKQDAIFSEYHFLVNDSVPSDETDHSSFRISLKILIEHLNMFTDVDSSLRLIYKGEGQPFTLQLEHELENLTTQCDIRTREIENFLEIDFDDDNVPCYVKFKGADFAHFIEDLYRTTPDGETIEVSIAPTEPYFSVKYLGSVDIKTAYALEKMSDMVLNYRCDRPLKFSYKGGHVKQMLKTLGLASTTSVAMDENGIICIKSTVADDMQYQVMVEYLIIALVDEDDRW